MNIWKAILATLVIFVAGVVTGGLLVSYSDHAYNKGHHNVTREGGRLPGNSNPALANNPRLPNNQLNRIPRGLSLEFLQKLDTEVHLAPGQRERIEKIIADGQLRNKAIMERVTPDLRREMVEAQKQIHEVLTPEQRVRWEELMKQSRPAVRRNNEPMPTDRRPLDQRRPLPPKGESQPDDANPPPATNP